MEPVTLFAFVNTFLAVTGAMLGTVWVIAAIEVARSWTRPPSVRGGQVFARAQRDREVERHDLTTEVEVSFLQARGLAREAAEILVAAGQPRRAAVLLVGAGHYEDAAAQFLAGDDLDSAIECLRTVGDLRGAIERCLECGELARAAPLEAELAAKNGEHDRAARFYYDAGMLDPAAAQYMLADRPQRAAEIWEECHRFDRAAEVWSGLGEHGRAAALMERDGDPESAAHEYSAAGMALEAASMLAEHLADQTPDAHNVCLFHDLVRQHQVCGQYRQALQTATRIAAAGLVSDELRTLVRTLHIDAARAGALRPPARDWRYETSPGAYGFTTAFDRATQETVDVKVAPLATDDPELVRRVQLEVRLLRRLDYPGLVRARDVEFHDGRAVFAIPGDTARTLAQVMEGREALPSGRVVAVARAIADALRYLHERRLVHGHLDLDHVLVAEDGTVRLLDVGLGRIMDEADERTDIDDLHGLVEDLLGNAAVSGGWIRMAVSGDKPMMRLAASA